MPFQYKISDQNKIVFTRLGGGCARFMFFSIGLLFTIIGAGLLYFTENPEMPLSLMRYLFPAFGLLAIYMSIVYPKIQKKNTPDEIIFDNTNGRVEINQKDSEVNTAYIYYDEIAQFIISAKKSQSSSSNNDTIRNNYTYHIYLDKKDGGQWELLKFGTEQSAQDELTKLNTLVDLNANPIRIPLKQQASQKYKISKGHQKVELNWRNKLGAGPIVLAIFAVVFVSILYAILSTTKSISSDIPVFGYIVGGFIITIFLIVIIGNAMTMLKNSNTDYAVSITRSSLAYLEKDRSGRIKKEVRFPFEELKAISFTFDSDETMRKLFIYTKKQFQQKTSIKPAFSIDYIKALINLNNSLISLDLQSLTPVEALYIENYLQEQIKEIGNTEVE